MSTAYKTWVLLCLILYLHHACTAVFYSDTPEMCVWAPLKWQETFRLQSSAALTLSAAQGLADSDTMCLCLLQKAYFLSQFVVGVYVWSLCIFGFVSLPAFSWTRACTCICVLPKCGWIIPSFSCTAVWGPSVCHVYVLESLCNWREPLKAPRHMESCSFGCLSVHTSIHFNCPELWLMDSHYYLLHGLSVGLNTLICNKVWDRADPWPWDWLHKA